MPDGVVPPVPEDDDGLIAIEPYDDNPHYDLEQLPQSKLPANMIQSVPEEDVSTSTPAADSNPVFSSSFSSSKS